jgi:hypothetical protein
VSPTAHQIPSSPLLNAAHATQAAKSALPVCPPTVPHAIQATLSPVPLAQPFALLEIIKSPLDQQPVQLATLPAQDAEAQVQPTAHPAQPPNYSSTALVLLLAHQEHSLIQLIVFLAVLTVSIALLRTPAQLALQQHFSTIPLVSQTVHQELSLTQQQ